MTSKRANAYGRVMRTIDEIGATKLLADEQERIRRAADSLLFCDDFTVDPDARVALVDVEVLAAALIESGRWTDQRAERLRDDLAGCGPLTAQIS